MKFTTVSQVSSFSTYNEVGSYVSITDVASMMALASGSYLHCHTASSDVSHDSNNKNKASLSRKVQMIIRYCVHTIRVNCAYSSEPRCVFQGVTDPAHGNQRPSQSDQSTRSESMILNSPEESRCSLRKLSSPGLSSQCTKLKKVSLSPFGDLRIEVKSALWEIEGPPVR